MKKEIELHNEKVTYALRRSRRAKRIRFAVYCDGSFVVTAPTGVSHGLIEGFIRQKSKWILDKLEYFLGFSDSMKMARTKKNFNLHKKTALDLVEHIIHKFNPAYGFKLGKISVRDQKTKWGSCSRNGSISFNYKIVFLPEELAEYVVVHELCHLGEFNHSWKFWSLVEKTIPDYVERQESLRKSGLKFH